MMFKLGDIVKLKDSQRHEIGYIAEIKAKTKFPWNIKVIFFNSEYDEYGHYEERNLEKVSDESER